MTADGTLTGDRCAREWQERRGGKRGEQGASEGAPGRVSGDWRARERQAHGLPPMGLPLRTREASPREGLPPVGFGRLVRTRRGRQERGHRPHGVRGGVAARRVFAWAGSECGSGARHGHGLAEQPATRAMARPQQHAVAASRGQWPSLVAPCSASTRSRLGCLPCLACLACLTCLAFLACCRSACLAIGARSRRERGALTRAGGKGPFADARLEGPLSGGGRAPTLHSSPGEGS